MTLKNKTRVEQLRAEIVRNRAEVERQLTKHGVDAKSAGAVSVAKYYVALKKLANS